MILQNLWLRTRLTFHEAIDFAFGAFRSPCAQARPTRELELSDLEDRVLLSAVPAAAMMPEQPAPAVELDQVAGMFPESAGDAAQPADLPVDDVAALFGPASNDQNGAVEHIDVAEADERTETTRKELVFIAPSVVISSVCGIKATLTRSASTSTNVRLTPSTATDPLLAI